MKEKGVSSIVVIAIVVVIVAVVVIGYFLLKGDEGGPGGLPVYSGSKGYDIPKEYFGEFLPEGVEIKAYTSSASVQDILVWYSDHMIGWIMENELTQSQMGMTIGTQLYRKGTEGAVVIAMGGTGIDDTIYVLATGSWSELGEWELQ